MTSRTGNNPHTPGPWSVWTSCSWRRIGSRDHGLVCEPIVQHPDNHPDLYFRNGGADGPDARLIAAAPDLLEALAECGLQIEYLHDKFGGTGSGETVLARARAAIALATNPEAE